MLLSERELEWRLQRLDALRITDLVEQAVQYANSLGFRPHADYKKARRILADCRPRSVLNSSPSDTKASRAVLQRRPALKRCHASE